MQHRRHAACAPTSCTRWPETRSSHHFRQNSTGASAPFLFPLPRKLFEQRHELSALGGGQSGGNPALVQPDPALEGGNQGNPAASQPKPVGASVSAAAALYEVTRLKRMQHPHHGRAIEAHRVREAVWHRSQELTELPKGRLELAVTVNGIVEIQPWIMSWGGAVEVLEPEELRKAVASSVRQAADRYAS